MSSVILAVLTVMAISLLLVREFAGVLSWRGPGKTHLALSVVAAAVIVAFTVLGIMRLVARA